MKSNLNRVSAQSEGNGAQSRTSQHGVIGENDINSQISNNKKESDQKRAQRMRKFRKDSTIYGIPVKNTSKLDYSQ